MENDLRGLKIEYHILQNFPVSCLNRDDVGSPKTASVGGVTRARVSSQCWKRAVRIAMRDLGVKLGIRTKHVADLIQEKCVEKGCEAESAKKVSEKIAEQITKDTLHFISESEVDALAEYAKEVIKKAVDLNDRQQNNEFEREIKTRHKNYFKPAIDGIDIALFGRMVAQAAGLNIEAACSFSHAISTHKVSNEVDFFTALDDYKPEERTDAGSSHLGTLEFNSATYYRYVSLDLGQLAQTLQTQDRTIINQAVENFTKALYVAVPSARQSTMAGNNFWDYAVVYVRKGQRLQASFEEPVRADYQRGGGYLQPSITTLKNWLESKEKISGSLFQKIKQYELGDNTSISSIDQLIEELKKVIEKYPEGSGK